MTPKTKRAGLGLIILILGLLAQTSLDASMNRPRPRLKAPLATIPFELGTWIGRDEPMEAEIIERTQADEYLNRVYEDPAHPGRLLKLWMNYSNHGLNLRHSPEVCLPSGGWSKVESMTRVLAVQAGGSGETRIMRLGYSQGDSVEGVAFWYYIFGEGPVEQAVRSLPIGSQSGHGRATRGSGLTIEIFHSASFDPEGTELSEFAAKLLEALEPLLPVNRAAYHVP